MWMNHQLKKTASKSLSSLKHIRINTSKCTNNKTQTNLKLVATTFGQQCVAPTTPSLVSSLGPRLGAVLSANTYLVVWMVGMCTCQAKSYLSNAVLLCGWTTCGWKHHVNHIFSPWYKIGTPYEINKSFGFCHQFEVVHHSFRTEGLSGVNCQSIPLLEHRSSIYINYLNSCLPRCLKLDA